jgi:hypothetical protein
MNEYEHNPTLLTDTKSILVETPTGARARAGLSRLGEALAGAGIVGTDAPDRPRVAGIDAMPIAGALASGEHPHGELLRECQGHADFRLVEHCLNKLCAKMRGAGRIVERPKAETVTVRDNANRRFSRQREVGGDEWRDARAAGLLALTLWRATGKGADGEPETAAARVAWRAIVKALSTDAFGDSVSIETLQEDWLWHNAEQRDESYWERVARRAVEVQATTRQLRLARRMANLPGGRGRRAGVIEKITRAATLLLDGFLLDEAAAAAGFNARGDGRGKHGAADTLIQACKRLGLIVRTGNGGQQFTARMNTREESGRRAEFVPMRNAARSLGSMFVRRWDDNLLAVSNADGCIDWQFAN